MSTIPDASALPVQQISGQQKVYRKDTTYDGAIPGVATELLKQQYEAQVSDELAKAKSEFQIYKIQQDSKYDTDDDEDTIQDRYDTGITDGLGKAASNITDARVRDKFIQETMPVVEQGKVDMSRKVHKKRADKSLAYVRNTQDIFEKTAGTTQNLYESFDAVSSMWESQAKLGYVSHDVAQDEIRKSKFNLTVNKLKTMEPEDQLEALKSDWATELPLDIRKQLSDEAKAALRLGKSRSAAQDAFEKGLSRIEASVTFSKRFSNPETAKQAEIEFGLLKQKELADNNERALELYNDYHDAVRSGDLTTHGIRLGANADWMDMTPQMKDNLQMVEERRAEGKTLKYSDRVVLHNLRVLQTAGPEKFEELREYFLNNWGNLNQTDWKQWNEIVVGKQVSSLFNHQTMLEQLTINMRDSKRADIYNGITQRYFDWQKRNGNQEPPDELVNTWIMTSIQSITNDKIFGVGTGSENPFSMDFEDRVDAYDYSETDAQREEFLSVFTEKEQLDIKLEHLKRRNPKIFDEIMEQFKGEPVDYDEFELLFHGLMEDRGLIKQ